MILKTSLPIKNSQIPIIKIQYLNFFEIYLLKDDTLNLFENNPVACCVQRDLIEYFYTSFVIYCTKGLTNPTILIKLNKN